MSGLLRSICARRNQISKVGNNFGRAENGKVVKKIFPVRLRSGHAKKQNARKSQRGKNNTKGDGDGKKALPTPLRHSKIINQNGPLKWDIFQGKQHEQRR